jgi:hypothetical protein
VLAQCADRHRDGLRGRPPTSTVSALESHKSWLERGIRSRQRRDNPRDRDIDRAGRASDCEQRTPVLARAGRRKRSATILGHGPQAAWSIRDSSRTDRRRSAGTGWRPGLSPETRTRATRSRQAPTPSGSGETVLTLASGVVLVAPSMSCSAPICTPRTCDSRVSVSETLCLEQQNRGYSIDIARPRRDRTRACAPPCRNAGAKGKCPRDGAVGRED